MSVGIDGLIKFLSEKVALCGEQGARFRDVRQWTEEYYRIAKTEAKLPFTPSVDEPFMDRIWVWLKETRDFEWTKKKFPASASFNSTSNDAASNIDPAFASNGSPEGSPPEMVVEDVATVTEDRVWRAITGHGIDYRRIPKFQFELLSLIAKSGTKGIHQPELVRITGQDKRSVPKRTKDLEQNGYIVRKSVTWNRAATSWLILRKRIPIGADLDEMYAQAIGDGKAEAHLNVTQMARATLIQLKNLEKDAMITIGHLREKVGVVGRRPRRQILNGTLLHMAQLGWIKLYYTSIDKPTPILTSISLIRDPSPKELNEFDRSYHRSDRSKETLFSTPFITDIQGLTDRNRESQSTSDDENCVQTRDEGQLVETEGIVGGSKGALLPTVAKSPLQKRQSSVPAGQAHSAGTWRPRVPFASQVIEQLAKAPFPGLTAADIGVRLGMKLYKKPFETLMGRLVNKWPVAQAQHLRDFTIIRDITLRYKSQTFIYRTVASQRDAVERDLTSWEAIGCKDLSNDEPSNIDDWGFTKQLKREFFFPDAAVSVSEAWKSAGVNRLRIDPHAMPVRGRPRKSHPKTKAAAQTLLRDAKVQKSRKLTPRESLLPAPVATSTHLPQPKPYNSPKPTQPKIIHGSQRTNVTDPDVVMKDKTPSLELSVVKKALPKQKQWTRFKDQAKRKAKRAWELSQLQNQTSSQRKESLTGTGILRPDAVAGDRDLERLEQDARRNVAPDKEDLAKLELEFLLMSRTGAYSNPPMRLPATRGRPRRRAIIVIKSEKLKNSPFFMPNTTDHASETRPMSPDNTVKHDIPFASTTLIKLLDSIKRTGHIPDDMTPTRSAASIPLPSKDAASDSVICSTDAEVHSTGATQDQDEDAAERHSSRTPEHRANEDTEMTGADDAVSDDASLPLEVTSVVERFRSSAAVKQPLSESGKALHEKDPRSSPTDPVSRVPKPTSKLGKSKIDGLKALQTGGTLAFRRRSVLTDILERHGGAYPGDREIGGSFRSEWQIRYHREGGAPDAATALKTVQNLIDQGTVARHSFAFKDKRGVTRQKSVIYLVNVENVQEKVKETQHRILQRFPYNYIPETDWFKFVDGSMPTVPEAGVSSIPNVPKKRKLDARYKDTDSIQKRAKLQQQMLQEGRSMPQYSSLAQNMEILNPSNPGRMNEAVGRLRVAVNEEQFDRMWKHVVPDFDAQLHAFQAESYTHSHSHGPRDQLAQPDGSRVPSNGAIKAISIGPSSSDGLADTFQRLGNLVQLPSIDEVWKNLQQIPAEGPPTIHPVDCLRILEWWEYGFSHNPSVKETKYNDRFITVNTTDSHIQQISPDSPTVPDFIDPLVSELSAEQRRRQVPWAPQPPAFPRYRTLKSRGKLTNSMRISNAAGTKRGPKPLINFEKVKRAKTGHRLWENGRNILPSILVSKVLDPEGELEFARIARLTKAKDEKAIEKQWKELESPFKGMIEFLLKVALSEYEGLRQRHGVPAFKGAAATDAQFQAIVKWISPLLNDWEDYYATILPKDRRKLENNYSLVDDGDPLGPTSIMKAKYPSQAQKRRVKRERFRTAPAYEAYAGKPRIETHATRIKKQPYKGRDNTGKPQSKIELTKNLVRANILVPDHKYDKDLAKAKFERFGNDYIDEALREMTEDRTILRKNKRKDIVGRNWKLNHRIFEEPFTKANFIGFKRFFSDAKDFKEQLDDKLGTTEQLKVTGTKEKNSTEVEPHNSERDNRDLENGDSPRRKSRRRAKKVQKSQARNPKAKISQEQDFKGKDMPMQDLSWTIENGEAMQVLEGMAANRLKLEVRVPRAHKALPLEYDMAKPVEPMAVYDPKRRVSKFGFNKMRYKSMHTDMSNCVFPLGVRTQPPYTSGVPASLPKPSRVTVPEAPHELAAPMKGRFPLWIDLNGDTVEPIFCQIVASACYLCAFRAGANAERLRAVWGDRTVSRAEVDALVKWMLRAKLLRPFGPKRHSMGLVVRDGAWDKVAELLKKAKASAS